MEDLESGGLGFVVSKRNYDNAYNNLFRFRQAEPEPGKAMFELDRRTLDWYG
jgi:hypothetical protein